MWTKTDDFFITLKIGFYDEYNWNLERLTVPRHFFRTPYRQVENRKCPDKAGTSGDPSSVYRSVRCLQSYDCCGRCWSPCFGGHCQSSVTGGRYKIVLLLLDTIDVAGSRAAVEKHGTKLSENCWLWNWQGRRRQPDDKRWSRPIPENKLWFVTRTYNVRETRVLALLRGNTMIISIADSKVLFHHSNGRWGPTTAAGYGPTTLGIRERERVRGNIHYRIEGGWKKIFFTMEYLPNVTNNNTILVLTAVLNPDQVQESTEIQVHYTDEIK